MAKSKQQNESTLPAPALNSPREAAVIDGQNVVFEWEPVDGATRYQLEVATEQEFEDLVVNRVVEGATSVTLKEAFEPDGTIYFWRVLAGDDAGWSNGDHVESFVSSTPEEGAKDLSRPDELLGPYPALIRSATAEAAAEVTGEESLLEHDLEMGVEHENVEAGQILGIVLAIIAAIMMMVVVLFQWTRIVESEIRYASTGISGYPELRQVEMSAQEKLTGYGAVEEGRYRIPIDRAMDLVVQEARQSGDSAAAMAFPQQ